MSCTPGSVRSEILRAGDHLSWIRVATNLRGLPFWKPSRLVRSGDPHAPDQVGSCPRIRQADPGIGSHQLGIAPGGGCFDPALLRNRVRSYRTISPLPARLLSRDGARLCHFCCPLRRRIRDEQNPRGICSWLASLRSRASRRAGVTCHPWKRETGNETLGSVWTVCRRSANAMVVQHPVSSLSNGARTFLIQHRFQGERSNGAKRRVCRLGFPRKRCWTRSPAHLCS